MSDLEHASDKRKRNTCYGIGCCCFIIVIALAIPLAIGFTRGFSSENSLESTEGYPVWSDDGTAICGVNKYWSNGLVFPPLQGFTGKVNPRFKVFIQDNGDRQDLATIKQHALTLYYMKSAGYVLVNYLRQPAEFRATEVISLDSQNTRTSSHLSNKGLGFAGGAYTAIPSRDGGVIAAVSWETEYARASGVDYFAYTIDFKVVLVDAFTMETLGTLFEFRDIVGLYKPNSVGSRQWPFYYWDDDSAFHMTDLKGFSVAFFLNGTMQDVEVPTCVPFPTESGPVRASDSARLYVDEAGERIEVQTDWEVEEPFLCLGITENQPSCHVDAN